MRLYAPDIFTDFVCSGSDCTDNCCTIGWDIEIDDKTLAFYKSLDSELGKRIAANIYEEDGCHYMGQEGGCPFMNENGLCSVQLEYGEEHISDICREHPRFYEWFGDYKEAGVGLSCEKTAQMLTEHTAPILFTERQINEEPDDLEFDGNLLNGVKNIRDRLIEILQNRGYTVCERLGIMLCACGDIQQAVDTEDCRRQKQLSGMLAIEGFLLEIISEAECVDSLKKSEVYGELAEKFLQMEYINSDLKERFVYIRDNIDRILYAEKQFDKAYRDNSFELEHTAVYFIYRYLIKAVRDYDIEGRIYSAVICTMMIRMLFMAEFSKRGELPRKEQRAFLIKEFSKEIEYSAENMDMLYDFIYEKCDDNRLFEQLKTVIFGDE